MLDIEDYDEQMEEFFIKSINAEIDETIENFIGYLRSSYNVENSLDEKTTEIYSAILLSMEHRDCHSAYLITGCETLENVLFELNEDIEMSIFLSIHGMYRPANVLLRRWLDTTISALSFDSALKKYKKKRPNKFDKILENGWNWLTKPHTSVTFKNRLYKNNFIDTKADNIAKQLLKEKPYFRQSSFKDYIYNLYTGLSKSAHYSGKNIFLDNQPGYNKEHFEEWYLKLNQINEICNILILLKFPEMITLNKKHKERFPTLEVNQMKRLIKLL